MIFDLVLALGCLGCLVASALLGRTDRKIVLEYKRQLQRAEALADAGHTYIQTLELEKVHVRRLLGARMNESTVEAVLRAAHERSRRELRS